MSFSQVEAEFRRLRAQFEAGDLTEAAFKTQLEELMIKDEHGRWWIIGPETGQWYVHEGETWVQKEPPRPAPVFPSSPSQEAMGERPASRQGLPQWALIAGALILVVVVVGFLIATGVLGPGPTPEVVPLQVLATPIP